MPPEKRDGCIRPLRIENDDCDIFAGSRSASTAHQNATGDDIAAGDAGVSPTDFVSIRYFVF